MTRVEFTHEQEVAFCENWNKFANDANQLETDRVWDAVGEGFENEMAENGFSTVEVRGFQSKTGNPITFTVDQTDAGFSDAGFNIPVSAEGVTGEQLRAVIERIERLNEEKAEILELIKDVYAEAKGIGFDVKTLRKVISERKKAQEERDEESAMIDLYFHALGMK